MLHKFSKGTTAGSSYKGYVLFGRGFENEE
jgi:hypothetical protein